MASRKSDAGVSRPKKAPAKNAGMMQFILVGAGIVVVIVLAIVLFGGGGKKAAAPKAAKAKADEDAVARTPRKPSGARTSAVSKRELEREKRREERAKRREEAEASGSRTTRTSSGGYSRSGSTRDASAPNQLRAILTDPTGSRLALVGERRLKAGDDVDGHKIVEVSSEGVKVEYRQNTYTVRVGEKIY